MRRMGMCGQRNWAFYIDCLFLIIFWEIFRTEANTFHKKLHSLEHSDENLKPSIRKTRLKRNTENDTTYDDLLPVFSFAQYYEGPVCDLIEIKHGVKGFQDLNNCVIVNGPVRIYFINDNPLENDVTKPQHDLMQYSFPKLRVITQYLLIYRVYGLTTLRKLFPNLVMIGGRKLIDNYALVLFENPDLLEIGLGSLRIIQNGGVRVEKNGKLCYLQTIKWPLLGEISDNEDVKRPVLINNKEHGCLDQCGNKSACSIEPEGDAMQHCWGLQLCQAQPCPKNCSHACDKWGQCVCHPECLGGCNATDNASACFACKHFNHEMTCVSKCPDDTLESNGWQCVTHEHCSSFEMSIHDGKCLHDCPLDHKPIERGDKLYCVRCNGTCLRECEGSYEITAMHSLESVHRCTKITGQLVITVTGAEVAKLLNDTLGDLKEVGALVVKQSKHLTSLSFLRNLRKITGPKEYLVKSAAEYYSVYVLDNKRLRDLWDMYNEDGKPKLTIAGKAFFQFNPMLCQSKIEKLTNITTEGEDEHDISKTTNGDRITCELVKISNVTVRNYSDSETVHLKWKSPEIDDYRTLIGYHLYYREREKGESVRYAEEEEDNFDIETSRWSVQDVSDNATNGFSEALLHSLNPYTWYACYVVTYTTATAKQGARSEIFYFLTNPFMPSRPTGVEAKALNTSAISLKWNPPRRPNGNITHYIVRYTMIPPNLKVVETLNTCDYRRSSADLPIQNEITYENLELEEKTETKESCTCYNEDQVKDENQVVDSQTFEDHLINTVIPPITFENFPNIFPVQDNSRKKRSLSLKRYRRSLNSDQVNVTTNVTYTTPSTITTLPSTNATVRKVKKRIVKTRIVKDSTNITITGLDYYTEYYFDVVACNHASAKYNCSTGSIASRVTYKLEGADAIPSDIGIQRKESGSYRIFLTWQPPVKPNGFIKFYQMFLQRDGGPNITICCSVMEYLQYNQSCPVKADVGKYTATIQPVSIAAHGVVSSPISFELKSDEEQQETINQMILLVSIPIIILLLCLGVFFFYKKYKIAKMPSIYASVNPDYARYPVYIPDEYEIAEEDVELIREIGQGHFGKVYEGIAKRVIYGELKTKVAVKTLHGNETVSKRMEFLKEATVMKAFNAYHVVRLLGVVSTGTKPMVIMEYMALGDLKTYLRSTRPDAEERRCDPPLLSQRLQMCGEIADGMAYLADNKFVHRDLAARNCLVHQNMTVKIGDFGLTRDVYETDYYRIDSRGILPVRWMAPESLKDGVFDSRSDVWSYGIVLWEVANLAEQPYQGQNHEQVTRFVIDGGYMEQPRECPKKLYDLMLMCWHYSPAMRPTFMEIISYLSPDLSEEFMRNSFFHENRDIGTEDAEEETFLGDSLQSSDGAIYANNADARANAFTLRTTHTNHDANDNNHRHLNGGHVIDASSERTALVGDNDETDHCVSNHVQSHTSTV